MRRQVSAVAFFDAERGTTCLRRSIFQQPLTKLIETVGWLWLLRIPRAVLLELPKSAPRWRMKL